MNGIIVVNKDKNVTSRDIVNNVCKILNTKKIGHTGTLDPIATGVLVLCVGKATKLVDLITCEDKEYIATVKLGIITDTLDVTGNILDKMDVKISKDLLINTLNSFVGEYEQEVPIYSAVKINGKKLYEYARRNIMVDLPKRKVQIKEIKLLELGADYYKFKAVVSKGTYIRSLIRDINTKLNVIGVMSDLIRTRQGKYTIDDSYSISDISNNNYRVISISDVLSKYLCVDVDEKLYNTIINGGLIKNTYSKDFVVFKYNKEVIAMYKKYEKEEDLMKPYKMFTNNM